MFFYFTAPWQLVAFHALFLFCCAAFMLGWRTSWVKWVVLIGQISYDYRNPMLPYGVDKILACLLLILCLAPIGRAHQPRPRARGPRGQAQEPRSHVCRPTCSPWAGACTRLMQIQMAVLFFFSGIGKLQGDDWWNGDAIWIVFTTNDTTTRSSWTCSRRTTGWSMSRPMARS